MSGTTKGLQLRSLIKKSGLNRRLYRIARREMWSVQNKSPAGAGLGWESNAFTEAS
jgi:hypothetical protein